jgi:hypothetical protein
MGKKLDDLQLTDQPIASPAPTDPRDTEWYRFARDIDDLLATGHYSWAYNTLTDIQATVEARQYVSEGQRRAVANIEASTGRYGSRRYEGYPGRRRSGR